MADDESKDALEDAGADGAAEEGARQAGRSEEAPEAASAAQPAGDADATRASLAKASAAKPRRLRLSAFSLVIGMVIGAAAVVVAMLAAGRLTTPVLSAGPQVEGRTQAGTTAVTRDQLDRTVVGTCTYKGKATDITAAQVVSMYTGIDNDLNANDSNLYDLPTADQVLSYARGLVLDTEAQAQGYSASDDECLQYLASLTGNQAITYASASQQLGLSVEEIKTVAARTVRLQKLEQAVTGETSIPAQPQQPDAPSVGDGQDAADVASADYKAYVQALISNDYDFTSNTWTNEQSPYRSALSGFDLTAGEYTYGCAEAAYGVAAQQYYNAATAANSAWSSYVNDLFSRAGLSIYLLEYGN